MSRNVPGASGSVSDSIGTARSSSQRTIGGAGAGGVDAQRNVASSAKHNARGMPGFCMGAA